MNPEELKKLAGDAKPNTLKEWLAGWRDWASYREAMGREASITPGGQRDLATLILLDKLLGPECQDKDCADYDGEHPYHESIGVRMHEEGQRKLRSDYEKTKQELSNANDRIRELLENMKRLDHLEKLSHSIRDQSDPRIGLGDGERASLEHARIIYEALNGVKLEGTVTGRLSSAHPNRSNKPKTLPNKTVHILSKGLPKCNFSPFHPESWPPGHIWVREEEKDTVLEVDRCAGCYFPAQQAPKVFFLNETHELPRTTKSQVRRDKKAKKLEQELFSLRTELERCTPGGRKANKLKSQISQLQTRIEFFRTPRVAKVTATISEPVAWAAKVKK